MAIGSRQQWHESGIVGTEMIGKRSEKGHGSCNYGRFLDLSHAGTPLAGQALEGRIGRSSYRRLRVVCKNLWVVEFYSR
jgi:hypothetical protein